MSEGESRKRRKLSPQSKASFDADIQSPVNPPTSRIKRRNPGVGMKDLGHLKETIISNGKVVDAKSSFATLNVAPWLIASLSAMAIYRPTAIQKVCIPKILEGADVIGGSKTGSGKTVTFAVPILQKWAEDPVGIFAVILTPTRYGLSAR